MKMIGEWKEGNLTSGRWIYPNGIYWEGSFENNKPKGEGVWFFKNGNQLKGTFEQNPKVKGDDDEGGDDEELDADGNPIPKKAQFDLVWKTQTNISTSAHQVNSVEQ